METDIRERLAELAATLEKNAKAIRASLKGELLSALARLNDLWESGVTEEADELHTLIDDMHSP
jgi:hypothetical protein